VRAPGHASRCDFQRSDGLESGRGHLARAFVFLEFEAHALAFIEAVQAGPLDGGDVNEDVRSTRFRLNEAIAFLLVEPLNSAGSHVEIVFR
jgi:hypothetical protein